MTRLTFCLAVSLALVASIAGAIDSRISIEGASTSVYIDPPAALGPFSDFVLKDVEDGLLVKGPYTGIRILTPVADGPYGRFVATSGDLASCSPLLPPSESAADGATVSGPSNELGPSTARIAIDGPYSLFEISASRLEGPFAQVVGPSASTAAARPSTAAQSTELTIITPGASAPDDSSPWTVVVPLEMGQGVRMGDYGVQFVNVPSDSRCPIDVVCVWAGEVDIEMRLWAGGEDAGLYTFTVGADGCTVHELDGFLLQVTSVEPEPISDSPIALEDYRVMLHISSPARQ